MKYQSKLITIEAEQWFPGKVIPGVFTQTPEEAVAIIGGRGHGQQVFQQTPKSYVVTIHRQRAYLDPGDWVIMEPDGEHFYPCKPDIFEKRYELTT